MHLPLRRTLNHMYKILHKGWKVGWHGVLASIDVIVVISIHA